jgi:hypothetical protein
LIDFSKLLWNWHVMNAKSMLRRMRSVVEVQRFRTSY